MADEKGAERPRRPKPRPAIAGAGLAADSSRHRPTIGAGLPRGTAGAAGAAPAKPGWTFLTNHAHVLLCIADEPDIRGRDIAANVGITERAAQAIIADLVAGGYIRRRREGRRNRYSVEWEGPLRHPLDHGHTVGELLAVLGHLTQSGGH